MSATEVTSWQAWLRRNPQGLRWQNWVQASFMRQLAMVANSGSTKGLPKIRDYLWQPPEPLMATRLKAEARAKREKSEGTGKRRKAKKP